MKFFTRKKLAAAVLSTSLMIASIQVEAAPNFFEEVPMNDWSYSAVNELISTGNVPGYNQAIPSGRIMTRMEMAMIVDEAMQNQRAFTPSQRQTIERLSQEYFYDIKKVRMLNKLDRLDEQTIDNLNKPSRHTRDKDEGEVLFTTEEQSKLKQFINRFEISGYARTRHDHLIATNAEHGRGWTPDPVAAGTTYTRADGSTGYLYPGVTDEKTRSSDRHHTGVYLTTRYKINDDWKANVLFSFVGSTDETKDPIYPSGEGNTGMNNPDIFITGKLGGGRGVDVKFGRWNEWTPTGWGYDMDSDVTGVQFSFGKPFFRTNITATKVNLWDNYMSSGYLQNVRGYETDENTSFLGVRWDWNPNEKTDVHFGVHGMGAMTSRYQDDKKKNHVLYYYLHTGYRIDPNWHIRGGIINSNAKMIDHPWGEGGPNPTTSPGFWFNVWYKQINPIKPGTYDIWATYRKEPGKSWVTVTDWWPKNAEGFRVGADVVVAKNMIFTTYADKIKEIDTRAKQTRYRFQMIYNFE